MRNGWSIDANRAGLPPLERPALFTTRVPNIRDGKERCNNDMEQA